MKTAFDTGLDRDECEEVSVKYLILGEFQKNFKPRNLKFAIFF